MTGQFCSTTALAYHLKFETWKRHWPLTLRGEQPRLNHSLSCQESYNAKIHLSMVLHMKYFQPLVQVKCKLYHDASTTKPGYVSGCEAEILRKVLLLPRFPIGNLHPLATYMAAASIFGTDLNEVFIRLLWMPAMMIQLSRFSVGE